MTHTHTTTVPGGAVPGGTVSAATATVPRTDPTWEEQALFLELKGAESPDQAE